MDMGEKMEKENGCYILYNILGIQSVHLLDQIPKSNLLMMEFNKLGRRSTV